MNQHPIARIVRAAPDVVTAAIFLLLWLSPMSVSAELGRASLPLMLTEFLLIHAGAFTAWAVYGEQRSRLFRSGVLLGIGSLYVLLALGFSVLFDTMMPVLMLGWMVIGKLELIWATRTDPAARAIGHTVWAASTVAFIVSVVGTAMVPLPALGIDAAVRARWALPGTGLWIEQPQTIVAAGLCYFAALAVIKWRIGPRV